jgi:hypothetical protein
VGTRMFTETVKNLTGKLVRPEEQDSKFGIVSTMDRRGQASWSPMGTKQDEADHRDDAQGRMNVSRTEASNPTTRRKLRKMPDG